MAINIFASSSVIVIGAVLFAIGMGWLLKVKKKDAFKTAGVIILVIGLIATFVRPVSDVRDLLPSGVTGAVTGSTETPTPTTPSGLSSALCSTTRQSTVYGKLVDDTASTATYLSAGSYLTNSIGEFINASSMTSASGSYASLGTTFTCPSAYNINYLSEKDNASSVVVPVTVDKAVVYSDAKSHAMSYMQFRLEDNTAPASSKSSYAYRDNDYTTNTTSYVQLNESVAGNTSNANANDWSIGTDGKLDLTIFIKTEETNKFGGDQDMWAVVDLGTASHWQQPSVSFNGVALSDAKATLVSTYPDSSTGTLITSAEYAYKLGDGKTIRDTEKQFQIKVDARSGVNPDSSDDIKVCFLSAGKFISSKYSNKIVDGIYSDGSTQSLVITRATPCVTIPTA